GHRGGRRLDGAVTSRSASSLRPRGRGGGTSERCSGRAQRRGAPAPCALALRALALRALALRALALRALALRALALRARRGAPCSRAAGCAEGGVGTTACARWGALACGGAW